MIENVTYALEVAATNGNGLSVFFRDPNFVAFRHWQWNRYGCGSYHRVLRTEYAIAGVRIRRSDGLDNTDHDYRSG